jgi:glycopeptide antibiotics resistance protein
LPFSQSGAGSAAPHGFPARGARISPWLWLFSAIFIVYGTTIPFQFAGDAGHAAAKWSHVTFNPLVSAETGRRVSIPDVVQNVLLFVPFGLFGVAALGRRGWLGVLTVTALGALLSAAVEILQLFTVDRTTSASDVVTNSAGALAGALIARPVGYVMKRGLTRLKRAGLTEAPAFYPVFVAGLMLCIAAWEPFDVTLEVGVVGSKIKALLRDPWQGGVLTDEGLEFLRYFLFASVTARWLRQLRVDGSAAVALGAGLVAAGGLECSQILIESRLPGLRDLLVHGAGVLSGAALSDVLGRVRSPRLLFGLLAIATTFGAALQMLSPFTIAPTYRSMALVPFLSYYEYTSLQTVSNVTRIMISYFPLGFAAALVAGRSPRMWALAIAAVLAIATPIEVLQGWIGEPNGIRRYPDITDIGIAVLGCTFGAWAGASGWARFLAQLEAVEARPVRRSMRTSAARP